MKKLFYGTVMLLCTVLLWTGCERNTYVDEVNKKITKERNAESVEAATQSIEAMTRKELTSFSGSMQRDLFNMATPAKRKALWLNKLDHLKSVVKTKGERNFVSKIEGIANGLDFDSGLSPEKEAEMDAMLYEAALEFNWSKTFVVYAFGTLHDMDATITAKNDFFGAFESEKGIVYEDLQPLDTRAVDCNCRWGWCPDGGDCEESGCEQTNHGCGLLWLWPCTKECSPIVIGDQ